jgi:hypothetical protein
MLLGRAYYHPALGDGAPTCSRTVLDDEREGSRWGGLQSKTCKVGVIENGWASDRGEGGQGPSTNLDLHVFGS